MSEGRLDHSEERAQLDEMSELLDRAAAAQNVAHEAALLEAEVAASRTLSTHDGEALSRLREDVLCERVFDVLRGEGDEARLDRESYRAEVADSWLARRFGDEPLVWWRTLDAPATPERPGVPPSHQVIAGEPMVVRVGDRRVWGVYTGIDWLGRPHVRARHRFFAEVLGVEWQDAWFLRPRSWRERAPSLDELRAPIIGTEPSRGRACDARAAAAFSTAIDRAAIGEYSVRHFIDAMRREGYFVCTRGSAVRDALNGDAVKDVDIVTSAPPVEVLRIIAAAAPEYSFGDAAGRLKLQRMGIVRVNPKMMGLDGAGFDVTSMKRWDPPPLESVNAETNEFIGPPRLGTSLEEDAWSTDWHINTLYAYLDDASQWMLSDPTGYAWDDVVSRRLRETRCRYNPRLSARFWKFRMRGYDGDARTKANVRVHFEAIARELGPRRLAWIWNSIAGSALESTAALQRFMTKLGAIMREDGAGDLFDRYLNTPSFIELLSMTDGTRLMLEAPLVEETDELW